MWFTAEAESRLDATRLRGQEEEKSRPSLFPVHSINTEDPDGNDVRSTPDSQTELNWPEGLFLQDVPRGGGVRLAGKRGDLHSCVSSAAAETRVSSLKRMDG